MEKIFETEYGKIVLKTHGKRDFSEEKSIDFQNPIDIKNYLSTFYSTQTKNIYGLSQIHGTDIILAENSELNQKGDGIWTEDLKNILYIKTADCMPIYFWSENYILYGILHSGWKGTKDGITEKLIYFIKNKYPKIELKFFLGPCIRGNEYEVKEDVSIFFQNIPNSLVYQENKIYLGLEKILCSTIENNGMRLDDCGISTLSHPDYFSHRGKDIGRNLNTIRVITEAY